MTAFEIRPAQLSDRGAIVDLLEGAYPPRLGPLYDAEVLAAAMPAIARASTELLTCGTWYVALTQERKVVGCGGWTRERPGTGELEPGLAHLRHFATHIDYQRQGVGRALGRHSLAAARAAGIEVLECDASLSARDFYTQLGFEVLEETTAAMPILARPGEFVDFPTLRMRARLRR